jgi:hypothetical protein
MGGEKGAKVTDRQISRSFLTRADPMGKKLVPEVEPGASVGFCGTTLPSTSLALIPG